MGDEISPSDFNVLRFQKKEELKIDHIPDIESNDDSDDGEVVPLDFNKLDLSEKFVADDQIDLDDICFDEKPKNNNVKASELIKIESTNESSIEEFKIYEPLIPSPVKLKKLESVSMPTTQKIQLVEEF